jgi:hypothetical protein
MLDGLAGVQAKGARPLALGGINGFLRIHAAANKSGALLLIMFDFTIRRGDERLTKGGAESAVRNALRGPFAIHAAAIHRRVQRGLLNGRAQAELAGRKGSPVLAGTGS